MKILYLQTNTDSDSDMAEELRGMGNDLITVEIKDEEKAFAEWLLALLEQGQMEVVFSLRYIPTVSIVCQAVKVKYVIWATAPYDPNLYSCTLLNECNYIFLSDYRLFEDFFTEDFLHLHYLPLGARRRSEAVSLSEKKEYRYDLAMLQDIVNRAQTNCMPLSPKSPLRDSTKGYLEGCIACQYQIAGLPSMAEHLPPYVWEDLTACFPPRIAADSIETAAHYYDHHYFNPLITWADRDIHYHALAKNRYFNESIQKNSCSAEDFIKIIRDSKINLVITHRNWRSGIPQISWDIMAVGGFLLSNWQADFLRIFSDHMPVLYENERDMLSKGIYYLHHEDEREELAGELAAEVRERHTCRRRLTELLESL